MNPLAKTLVIVGIILITVGLLWQVGGKWFPLGRLPGDISIDKGNVKFYFPIVTCIIISIVISLISYLVRLFK
ncbi:DUF2905 domain-containing protein [Risungbinella massiliensis]|uniref:DUF2905 domain-containing protein n=1 Tax=Risungbinella massiliensis TaxID=1329796 RepID=UPI0005CBBFF5|nr:DUF2905 domain-containing protein [Risungbinella massiliensis]